MQFWKFIFISSVAVCTVQKESPSAPECEGGANFSSAVYFPNAKNEFEGVQSEYSWIQKCYQDWKVTHQSVSKNQEKIYDLLHIENPRTHEKKEIYFNISNWFGKLE